jgi:hypothetical protein
VFDRDGGPDALQLDDVDSDGDALSLLSPERVCEGTSGEKFDVGVMETRGEFDNESIEERETVVSAEKLDCAEFVDSSDAVAGEVADAEPVPLNVAGAEKDAHADAVGVPVFLADVDAAALNDCRADHDADEHADADELADEDDEGEKVSTDDAVALEEGQDEIVVVAVRDSEMDALLEMLPESEGDSDNDSLGDADDVLLAEKLAVGVAETKVVDDEHADDENDAEPELEAE